MHSKPTVVAALVVFAFLAMVCLGGTSLDEEEGSVSQTASPSGNGAVKEANMNSSTEMSFRVLSEYLRYMGDKLDCRFTFEETPNPQSGAFPWIVRIKDFERDTEIATIDALVDKLDEDLEGVKAVRSTKVPSVVHLISESLLEEGYVMEEIVTVEYSGYLGMLADHLGTLLDGKIETRKYASLPPRIGGDFTTEVEVNLQNETVRDVLLRPPICSKCHDVSLVFRNSFRGG